MTIFQKKEDLIKHNLKSRYNLKKLLNNFNLPTDPKDKIKDVRLACVYLKSYNGNYSISLRIANRNQKISDIIKLNDLAVKAVELNVIFYDKKPILVKLRSFSDKNNKLNPLISKYLCHWGLSPNFIN